MAITQRFIAEKANISQKTVSQYFQGKARISDDTRKRLEKIVAQYGYFPNTAARTIKTRRFNRISCLLIYNGRTRDMTTFPTNLLNYVNAVATELSQYGYSLSVEPFKVDNDNRKMIDSPESLSTLSVDGILAIVGGWIPPEVDETIEKIDIPVVWLNRSIPASKRPMISFDEKPGIAELVDYLIAKGCKKIAWHGPDYTHISGHHSSIERLQILESELKRHGQKIYLTSFNSIGKTLCPSALALFDSSSCPDAVICYNSGFREATEQAGIYRGLRPGYDFECIHFASECEFSPACYDIHTYVALPEEKVGRQGAIDIYNLIKGKKASLDNKFQTSLHIGKTFEDNL